MITLPCGEVQCDHNHDGECHYEQEIGAVLPCPPGEKCEFSSRKRWYEPATTDEQKKQVVELLKAGKTHEEIKEITGLTGQAISKIKQRYNKAQQKKPKAETIAPAAPEQAAMATAVRLEAPAEQNPVVEAVGRILTVARWLEAGDDENTYEEIACAAEMVLHRAFLDLREQNLRKRNEAWADQ
jgi:hypothetical protein